LDAETFLQFV